MSSTRANLCPAKMWRWRLQVGVFLAAALCETARAASSSAPATLLSRSRMLQDQEETCPCTYGTVAEEGDSSSLPVCEAASVCAWLAAAHVCCCFAQHVGCPGCVHSCCPVLTTPSAVTCACCCPCCGLADSCCGVLPSRCHLPAGTCCAITDEAARCALRQGIGLCGRLDVTTENFFSNPVVQRHRTRWHEFLQREGLSVEAAYWVCWSCSYGKAFAKYLLVDGSSRLIADGFNALAQGTAAVRDLFVFVTTDGAQYVAQALASAGPEAIQMAADAGLRVLRCACGSEAFGRGALLLPAPTPLEQFFLQRSANEICCCLVGSTASLLLARRRLFRSRDVPAEVAPQQIRMST
ncbi:unnamed protein product [Amoebophrya sp. A120]|nr:unnamed protein product [Amoebophrya sp. A120]|eukprot:GSA120T00002523001.1